MNRPIALMCYICGRQFGTKSLAFHLKACEVKWKNEQNLKPPRQRRPCPQAPPGLLNLLQKKQITRQDILSMNNHTFGTYMDQALVQCQYCGRKFNQNSLKPHQKACATNPMIKKHYVSTQQKKQESQGSAIKQNQGSGIKSKQGSEIKQNHGNEIEIQQKEQSTIKVPSKGYDLSNIQGAAQQQTQDLQQCGKCGRKFASDRLDKHQKVCKGQGVKVAQKKQIVPPVKQAPKKDEKEAKWKAQSSDLQNAMKYMRKLKKFEQNGGKLSDLPPPPKSNYDHYIQCQYCGRKFAADVAERHIPKCQNIINKPGGIKPSQIQQKYIGNSGVKQTSSTINSSALTKSVISGTSKPSPYIKPASPMKQVKSPTNGLNSLYGKAFKR